MFKIMTGSLNKKKNPTESDIEKIPSYIFCRWLSGSPHCIFAANQINQYDKIPIVQQYKLVKHVFAGKIRYIPYPKNSANNQSEDVKIVANHFNINENNAREYLEFISKEELSYIKNLYI